MSDTINVGTFHRYDSQPTSKHKTCETASDEDDDNDDSFPWLNFPIVEPFNIDTCWWKQHKFHAGRQPNNSSDSGENEEPSESAPTEVMMAEEESISDRNIAYGRTSSKRGRVAQVYSLSERRRRERINEKMRALKELIPNCDKADRASMLDEAIEYTKTLQLQVQIMSVGAGMYLPPMMFPAALENMQRLLPMGMTQMPNCTSFAFDSQQLPSLFATPPMSIPLASVDVPVLPPSYQMLQNAILKPHMTKKNSQKNITNTCQF
ncbi:hypothetical protein V2J09_022578 [Rumex salicifolius]